MEKYKKSISDVYNIPADKIKDKPKYDVSGETTKKADELDKLHHIAMKEKLTLCSYPENNFLLLYLTVGLENIVQNILMFQNT